ncbi:MAG: cell division protein FtsA [Patescibacteria group bacterium]
MAKKGKKLIAGLDIGSSFIRMAVGQLAAKDGGDELQILSAAEVPSEGVYKGSVKSIEDAVSSISACYEKVEQATGAPVESVFVGVSGPQIVYQDSKGVIAVSKADNEISSEDTERAVEAARTIAAPLNYDILDVLPLSFSVDGQTGIKDPIGMTGMRLEVDTKIILCPSIQIKNLTKAVYRSGLEIDGLVFSILASAEAVVSKRQKEIGVAVVNIGHSTTSMAVFEEDNILHTVVIPEGSVHITNDIAIGLRNPIEIAEEVKIKFGGCFSDMANRKDEIDLYEAGAAEHEKVRSKYVSEIIEARMEQILQKIENELVSIQRAGRLPAGIVFTGAGAKLPGLMELAKKQLRLPAMLGYPVNLISITDKVNDLGFSTAVGLVKMGFSEESGDRIIGGGLKNLSGKVNKASNTVKKWFDSLLS